jgi:hypothetical protein
VRGNVEVTIVLDGAAASGVVLDVLLAMALSCVVDVTHPASDTIASIVAVVTIAKKCRFRFLPPVKQLCVMRTEIIIIIPCSLQI